MDNKYYTFDYGMPVFICRKVTIKNCNQTDRYLIIVNNKVPHLQ